MATIDDVVVAVDKLGTALNAIVALLTKPPAPTPSPATFGQKVSGIGEGISDMSDSFDALASGDIGAVVGELGSLGDAVAGLANPLTAIPAAIGLAIAAFVAIGNAAKDLAANALKGVEYLKDFSGAMASVFARKEVFETMQNIKVGAKLAEGAGNVESAYENISTAMEPTTSALSDIWNNGVAILVDMVAGIFKMFFNILPIAMTLQFIADILKAGIKVFSFGADPIGHSKVEDWVRLTPKIREKPVPTPVPLFLTL